MTANLPVLTTGSPPLDAEAMADLARAVHLLEDDRFAARVATVLSRAAGGGASWARRMLPPIPEGVLAVAQDAATGALRTAVAAATWRLDARRRTPSWVGNVSVAMTGAAGGAAGLAGTLAELPATTTLLLREIARIAAEEGEDLSRDETRAECLSVFALGGHAGEGGYYAARLALSEAISGVAGRALGDVMPRMLTTVASRFGVPVAWKLAGQAVPVAGAAAGATINTLFLHHFRSRARGHFTVRRLERRHGAEAVQEAYAALRDAARFQSA